MRGDAVAPCEGSTLDDSPRRARRRPSRGPHESAQQRCGCGGFFGHALGTQKSMRNTPLDPFGLSLRGTTPSTTPQRIDPPAVHAHERACHDRSPAVREPSPQPRRPRPPRRRRGRACHRAAAPRACRPARASAHAWRVDGGNGKGPCAVVVWLWERCLAQAVRTVRSEGRPRLGAAGTHSSHESADVFARAPMLRPHRRKTEAAPSQKHRRPRGSEP